MKTKAMKLCSLLMALLAMTFLLTACGGGDENPFLGDWDDDAGEQSLIFLEDGTGAQTSYYGAIEFTYTWEGDTVTITSEELGISAEATLEDNVLYMDYSSFVKVDQAAYVPENLDEDDSEEGYEDDSEGNATAPDSIEAWYGEYAGDAGTLSITDSLENMVDFTLQANDGSYMSGTWTVSDSGLGMMEDRELYVIYHVEDGSVEIIGKTSADSDNNASYIGVYYPVE